VVFKTIGSALWGGGGYGTTFLGNCFGNNEAGKIRNKKNLALKKKQ